MEAAIPQQKTLHHQIGAFRSKPRFRRPPTVSVAAAGKRIKERSLRMKCGGEAERIRAKKEEEEELKEEYCEEIAELMEWLEREAIMGGDEGREAADYNRRALIFDKSSRIFQALKRQTASAPPSA